MAFTKKRKAKQPIMNPKKKSRRKPDRLSDLPDALIVHILCLMELKDVVKTSVLSKRWSLLWTEVDTITITSMPGFSETETIKDHRDEVKRYISSVYKTLTRGISRIRNFSLGGFHFFTESHWVDKWIEYALELKVETLNIDYTHLFYFSPRLLFQSSSLTQLRLYRCLVGWPSPVNLTSLKSLSLDRITPENVHLVDLLSGCPVLETLVLIEITWSHSDIRIISPSLKKLKMVRVDYAHSVNYILEIRTPLLQELEISGGFMVRWCVTSEFSLLVKANLMFTICQPTFVDNNGILLEGLEETLMETQFSNDWIRMAEGLLKSISHVGELLIGGDLLEVLTLSAMSHKASPTFMCKHVTVVSPLWIYDLPGIVYLLEAAPHLESVSVDVSEIKIIALIEQLTEALSVAPGKMNGYANGNFLHLKNVKICYQLSSGANRPRNCMKIEGKHVDFILVDYILRSCIALERLVICSSGACSSATKRLDPHSAFRYVNRLSSRLSKHSLPQSEDAEWELKKRKFSLEYTFSNYSPMHFED